MTAKEIQKALDAYYATGTRYVVPNVYFFGNGYCETDMLVVKEGKGFIYDIEVKISRPDFKADFKKTDKHEILEHGRRTYLHPHATIGEDGQYKILEAGQAKVINDRPNRFYYAVPHGLVKLDEVPTYAGLLYVMPDMTVIKAKEAPLLHKDIIDPEPRLCRKFYFQARELREYKEYNGTNTLKAKISRLESEVDGQGDTIRQLSWEIMQLRAEKAELLIQIPKQDAGKQHPGATTGTPRG